MIKDHNLENLIEIRKMFFSTHFSLSLKINKNYSIIEHKGFSLLFLLSPRQFLSPRTIKNNFHLVDELKKNNFHLKKSP